MRLPFKNALEALPEPSGAGEDGGYFGPGNPGTGQPATTPGADWFNDVTINLRYLLAQAGIAPSAPGAAYDQTKLKAAIDALIAAAIPAAPAHDIPFLAGLDAEFAGQDLAVQTYGRVVAARDLVIEGEVAALDLAPTGAALILDVLVDGVSIYTTRPQFAAGSTALTVGEFVGAAEEVEVDAGSVIEFAVDQIGSTIAGQGLAFTVKAREA